MSSTETARDELASLIASFNSAWNHVRLSLDQQGMFVHSILVAKDVFCVKHIFYRFNRDLQAVSLHHGP